MSVNIFNKLKNYANPAYRNVNSVARQRTRNDSAIQPDAKKISAMKLREEQILNNTDKYNNAAEAYFQKLRDAQYLRQKPFYNVRDGYIEQIRFAVLNYCLNISLADTVLDFGAGTCWASALLNKMGIKTISLDVSGTALEIGKEVFSMDKRQRMDLNPQFLTYDGHRIPLEDGSVDRIVCLSAFHHIPNQQEILTEIYRVLKEGGKVGLSEPFSFEPGPLHSQNKDSIRETETYGVLENDIYLYDFQQKTEAVGFTNCFLMPFMELDNTKFTLDEYHSFLRNRDASPTEKIHSLITHAPLIMLEKGEERADSRHPRILRAGIKIREFVRGVKAGSTVVVRAEVENIGDTLWLSRPEADICRVSLGVRINRNNEMIEFAGRGLLARDIAPGEECEITLAFTAPEEKGRYVLEFDMVNELSCWFKDVGSEPLTMELEVVNDPG